MTSPPTWDPTLPVRGARAAENASKTELREALQHASQFLDTLPFKGQRKTVLQTFAWPRIGIVGKDGAPITGVPKEIVEATSLVAGFILAKIPFGPPALGHVFLLLDHLLEEDLSFPGSRVTWH